jgi:hypothetical protein
MEGDLALVGGPHRRHSLAGIIVLMIGDALTEVKP